MRDMYAPSHKHAKSARAHHNGNDVSGDVDWLRRSHERRRWHSNHCGLAPVATIGRRRSSKLPMWRTRQVGMRATRGAIDAGPAKRCSARLPYLKLPQTTGKLADVSKPSVFAIIYHTSLGPDASAFFSCCPLRCYFHNSRNGRFISVQSQCARTGASSGWLVSIGLATRRSIDRFRLITRVLHRSATGQQREALHKPQCLLSSQPVQDFWRRHCRRSTLLCE